MSNVLFFTGMGLGFWAGVWFGFYYWSSKAGRGFVKSLRQQMRPKRKTKKRRR